VRDGRITAVGSRHSVQVPADAHVLSAEGMYITAGFWNAHVHLNGFAQRQITRRDAARSGD
jgi:imidazolonepropionase-like amidohydrolase